MDKNDDEISRLVSGGLATNSELLYFENAKMLFFLLRKSGHYEALLQLVKHGPVWDGDVISKSRRNDLIRWGLAVRCCYKGEQGYTAARYYGWTIIHSDKQWLEDSMRRKHE